MITARLIRISTYGSMAVLLIYDIVKLVLAHDLMQRSGINPWIFFFLDVTTIPGYIIGWSRLISTMGTNQGSMPYLIKWSIITLFCTTAPYGYALWAGRATSPRPVFLALLAVILLLTVNMLRKLQKTPMAATCWSSRCKMFRNPASRTTQGTK